MNFTLATLQPYCKILVIRLRSIGDVVLNTPVLENIKVNLPGCRLAALVERPCDAALQGNPFVDEIIVREGKASPKKNGALKVLMDLKFFADIRRGKFDMVMDFHGGPRAALMTFLSGARWKMGHRESPRRWAYNLLVETPRTGGKLHTVKEQLSKLSFLGFRVGTETPRIWISEEEKEAMRSTLEEAGLKKDQPYAVIHPGVLKPHQRWQPEKMARIADHIQLASGLKVVFASAPEQLSQVVEIAGLMKSKAHSLAGKTSLRQLMALLGGARFVVCHNGGQMHLAAAAGTPVFALFGPSSPEIFGPAGKGHRVFYKNLPCGPCAPNPKYERCLKGNPECMALITAEEVIGGIDEFLIEAK